MEVGGRAGRRPMALSESSERLNGGPEGGGRKGDVSTQKMMIKREEIPVK